MSQKAQQVADIILSMTLDELDVLTGALYDEYHSKLEEDTFDLENQDTWNRLVWTAMKIVKQNDESEEGAT